MDDMNALMVHHVPASLVLNRTAGTQQLSVCVEDLLARVQEGFLL